jgi:hypothetical protein
MDQIDEFASLFRRAEREAYDFEEISIGTIVVVSDSDNNSAERWKNDLLAFLPRLNDVPDWRLIQGSDYHNVGELLKRLAATDADLVVTWRHLDEKSLVPQHSLGVYLDVLTQASQIPVLVWPGTAASPAALAERRCEEVMVVTDHISGDSRLINWGARMCPQGGELWLCHVEDDAAFERYMHAIARIPEIDTDQARELIDKQLLKQASDFIETCREVLEEKALPRTYQTQIVRGHRLGEYVSLVRGRDIDLVVTNTKDEGQLAMHGLAYSLAVEMQDVAQLLL